MRAEGGKVKPSDRATLALRVPREAIYDNPPARRYCYQCNALTEVTDAYGLLRCKICGRIPCADIWRRTPVKAS